MVHGFGNLAKVRGIISYTLSPFEQRAFAGVISKGIPNMFRRMYGQIFRVTPPFVLAYLIYDYGEKQHDLLQRKDMSEYANDE